MGGEACRPPAVPTAQPPGQGQGPARVGRGQGELVRGCQAALSQEAGPRPQRKGGSVGGGGRGRGHISGWQHGGVRGQVGQPAVRFQRNRS